MSSNCTCEPCDTLFYVWKPAKLHERWLNICGKEMEREQRRRVCVKVEDETQHWGWEGMKKGKGCWVGSSGAECCRKEKGGRGRKGGPGTQRQRNTHSCRVSTPISLYCSSCFTWASSCFSLESCGHKAEHRVTMAHNGLLSPPPPAKTA